MNARPLVIFLMMCACAQISFAQTDTLIGCTAPKGSDGSYKKLAHALCDELPDDRQKANAIYNWITHNIAYDVKAMQQGKLKEEDPQKVFRQRKGMCGGYSLLFAAMCNEAGLRALTVDGYSKDWMFDDGDKLYIPRHAWNVVYINNRWMPVDATWGAGCLTQIPGWLKRKLNKASKNPLQTSGKLKFKYQYDASWFLTDPLEFRLKHIPSDPVWQLTETEMPLQVFEAGQTAIADFNRQHPQLADNTKEQNEQSYMDVRDRIKVSAERVYRYNPRFHIVMAAKYQSDAVDTITTHAEQGTLANSAVVLNSVKDRLKQAQELVKEQKKSMTTEYTALSSKNKTKNLEAKQYINKLHSDNKRMMAQCQSRAKRVDAMSSAINKKAGVAAKGSKDIYAGKLSSIPTSPRPEPATSKLLLTLDDSVQQRNTRIDELEKDVKLYQASIRSNREINGKRLDTMAEIFTLADSALIQETISRIQMHDNYDEEVLLWNRLVKSIRLQQVDSMQSGYFAAYDTLNNKYEALRKAQWEQITLCRKNMTDLERYKRKNNNTLLAGQYDKLSEKHDSVMIDYYSNLADHKEYINRQKGLFKNLSLLYKRQEELAGYMEKSEEKRKMLEEKNLAKKEDFDKKENDKQSGQLKETGKKAEKLLSTR